MARRKQDNVIYVEHSMCSHSRKNATMTHLFQKKYFIFFLTIVLGWGIIDIVGTVPQGRTHVHNDENRI